MPTPYAPSLSESVSRAAATAALLLATAAAGAAPIVYGFDTTIVSANPTGNPAQSNTVRGTLTTDGTIGVLSAANILSWDLQLIDNLNATYNYTLTPSNSAVVVFSGSALSATPTGLFFDFDGTGEVGIQANDPGAFSGWRYFCFSTGVFACLRGETISPGYIFTDGAVLTGSDVPVGIVPLSPPVLPVPEPSMPALVGLGVLAAAARRQRLRG